LYKVKTTTTFTNEIEMQQESLRPISTYDNLSATKPKVEQLCGRDRDRDRESSGPPEALRSTDTDPNPDPNDRCNATLNGTHNTTIQLQLDTSNQGRDLNETSHSVAAVRAALIDAKCRFFGINNYDTLDAAVPSLKDTSQQEQMQIVPEHNYQNVPQVIRAPVLSDTSGLQPMKTTTTTTLATTPERSLRYGTTYEQIPLSDFDTPQPSQVNILSYSLLILSSYIIILKQAVYMSTTVPQNMKGIKIAGRHTPTRNSLRHSRMIVVNNKSQHSKYSTSITIPN